MLIGKVAAMPSTDINQVNKLWDSIKEIPTSILRIEDLHNKLSLCAVLAEQKKVAFIEPEDDNLLPNLQILRKILRKFKLLTSVTTLRRIQPSLDKTNIAPKIRSYFVELNASKKPTILLWAYKDKEIQSQLKPKMTNSQIGRILGYPSHCIKEYNKYIIINTQNYVNALKDQYSTNNDDEIIALIEKNAPVTYPKKDNTVKTLNKFPFLPYVACNKCLTGEYEISRKINALLEKLVRKIDSRLYNNILTETKQLVSLTEQ
ncbi:MAG: hypothetical protein ACFFA5_02015 [Promethearchaeota archaeon]